MADTSIEWTDKSWKPVRAKRVLQDGTALVGWHCTHKSEGCRNCYAETINRRLGTKLPYKPGHRRDVEIFVQESILLQPLKWRRPQLIFVGSMTDLFGEFVTWLQLDQVFAIAALCPQHSFQFLTKRPDGMRQYLSAFAHGARHVTDVLDDLLRDGVIDAERHRQAVRRVRGTPTRAAPLPNVWAGVSVEDQANADARRRDFEATPAAVKFVSYEPALGPVDWAGWEFVQQIISGGESGPRARSSRQDWHRATRDFCAPRGIAYFFKQWGAYRPTSDPTGEYMMRASKAEAGRVLDGVTHDAMPAGHCHG